jgi:hypothetical protein
LYFCHINLQIESQSGEVAIVETDHSVVEEEIVEVTTTLAAAMTSIFVVNRTTNSTHNNMNGAAATQSNSMPMTLTPGHLNGPAVRVSAIRAKSLQGSSNRPSASSRNSSNNSSSSFRPQSVSSHPPTTPPLTPIRPGPAARVISNKTSGAASVHSVA